MIYRGHRQQREEFENDPEIREYYKKLQDEDDYVDYDGHGNWGRFNPHNNDDIYYRPKRKEKVESIMLEKNELRLMCLSGTHYSIDDYEDRIIEMKKEDRTPFEVILNINMV